MQLFLVPCGEADILNEVIILSASVALKGAHVFVITVGELRIKLQCYQVLYIQQMKNTY